MPQLDINLIRNYLIDVGCKIEYPILVNAFKQYLYNPDPKCQAEIRTSFKDYVNRLATVSLENDMKFIILRPEFRPKSDTTPSHQHQDQEHQPPPPPPPPPVPSHRTSPRVSAISKQQQNRQTREPDSPPLPPPPPHKTIPRQSTPKSTIPSMPATPTASSETPNLVNQENQTPMSAQMPPPPPPRPPPRRRQSNASLFKQPTMRSTPDKSIELTDLAKRSPGKVREHAFKFNSCSIPNNLHSISIPKSHSMRENRLNRDSTIGSLTSVLQRNGHHHSAMSQSRSRSLHREDESDSSSLQPIIDPLKRRWVLEACSCNYNGLLVLLREDPKLASYRDIVNGYSALHWAAKFGNLDIIKLMAGTHQVSVDIKSNAGYTPLHVAYMFKKVEAANLLIKSYKANPFIRDHSGRRPQQLLTT